MKWILFYQTPNDRIKYMTDETYPDYTSLSYKKFCKSIFSYPVNDPGKVQEHIDTFHTLFLNIETGEWRQEFPDKDESFTFEELNKLNPNEEEKAQIEKKKKNREVELTKEYFNKVWENKRNKLFNDYGKNGNN